MPTWVSYTSGWPRSTGPCAPLDRFICTSTFTPLTTAGCSSMSCSGAEHFLNEVIWAYDYGGRARDRWPRKHDNILWYSKSGKWTFNTDDIDRIPYMAPGLVGAEKAALGKLPTDTWWLTIVPTSGAERTGYPTQKPLKLLERIIRASSNPGDLVADFFCGSGTTGVAAKRLGRRYLLVDDNPSAIRITNGRIMDDQKGSPGTQRPQRGGEK